MSGNLAATKTKPITLPPPIIVLGGRPNSVAVVGAMLGCNSAAFALPQINLFVGKNNTGKSSVLEAVELFVSDSPESMLRACARRTDEKQDFRYLRPYEPGEIARLVTLLVSQFHREKAKSKSQR